MLTQQGRSQISKKQDDKETGSDETVKKEQAQ